MDLDWPALARPRQTIVVYMGLLGLPMLCAQLIEHGLPADTAGGRRPAGHHARAARRHRHAADACRSASPTRSCTPPTLIIVGDVVRLRERLQWYRGADA